jgi:macrolide transport system ATP-binding/permease protein
VAQQHLLRTLLAAQPVAATAHLRLDGVSRVRGDRRVLTDVSFTVSAGERVGLIGENGAGKSTLLALVAGLDHPDAGTVAVPDRLGLLPQEPAFAPAASLRAVLDAAAAEAEAAVRDVELAGADIAAGVPGAALRLDEALAAADRTEAWTAPARREEVVAELGLGALPPATPVAELSGGQRSRLALAALLLARPSALLLDEPTNHLDDAAVTFLAAALRAWSGPVLFASHDRAFLDDVATRVLDLDPAAVAYTAVRGDPDAGTGVRSSRGGYSDYLEQRREARGRWQRRFEEEQEELGALRREVAVDARATNRKSTPRTEARASKKFYSDKDAKVTSRRVRNAAVRLERLEREQVRKPPAPLRFAGLPAGAVPATPGPLLLATRAAVAGRLAPVDLAVGPGDQVLVTGPNGAGKSTLLHLLHGTLEPTSGSVHRTAAARTALLAQDTVLPGASRSPRAIYAAVLGPDRAERTPLASLGLVAGRDLDRPAHALSVGQQRRLALALVLADPPAVLLLDEPTNHLSLALAEELEAALGTAAGALVLASHDRWLRRRWSRAELTLAPIR